MKKSNEKKVLIICGVLFALILLLMTRTNAIAPKKAVANNVEKEAIFTDKTGEKCELPEESKENVAKTDKSAKIEDVKKIEEKPVVQESKIQEKVLKDDFSNAIFIGDSITYGFTQAQNTNVSNQRVFARIGAHAFEGKKLLGSDKDEINRRCNGQVDYIFIMYGANDYGYDMRTYKKWYKELIHHARNMFPNAKIITQAVMPMENSSDEPNRISEPQKLNKIVQEVSNEEKTTYLDVASQIPNIRSLHVNDGLHFKSSLYPLWINVIKSNIK